MSATLCDLATKLPLLIGQLLDRETVLKRGRFREETMTDILTGSLAAFAGPELVIEYPPEADTGGDLDLVFWNVAAEWELNVRLQAKRLSAETEQKKPVKIQHRQYRELLHKPPTKTAYQFEELASAPPPWIPLYMFYNHESVARHGHFASGGPKVSGVNLAFAFDIANELDAKVKAAAASPKKVLHHKRLNHLRPHFFGLDVILCPPGDWGGAGVPPPHIIAAALLQQWNIRGEGLVRNADEDTMLRMLQEPLRLRGRHRDRPLIASGPSIRVNRQLKRPKVSLISGRTDDDRTPIIQDVQSDQAKR